MQQNMDSSLQQYGTSGHSFVLPRLQAMGNASNMAQNEQIHQLMAEGKTVYHFGFGQSPFPVAQGACRALAEHAGENAYLQVAGLFELRSKICDYHAQLDGLTGLDPNLVVVGPGTKQLIYLLIYVFNGGCSIVNAAGILNEPWDIAVYVLFLSPSWTTYKAMTTLAGKKAIEVASSLERKWRLTPDILEKAILENTTSRNLLLLFCNPDNPTGTSYTEENLKALSVVLRKHKVVVLSDEIYGHTQYEGNIPSLAKYYPEGTIVSNGLSKCFSAGGWRCGYNIYPKELSQLYSAVCSAASNTQSCVSAPMQYAAIHLLKLDDETKEYMTGCRIIMGTIARFCHRELTGIGLKAVMPIAGFYIFPDFEILRSALESRKIFNCQEMCEALFNETNVAVTPGGPEFLRPLTELTVRLCFVNFNGGAALEGWKRLGRPGALDQAFLEEYCSPVVTGIKAIVTWVQKQLTFG